MSHDREVERDRWIDRLVDGALSEPERQELLARLDAERDGDGWRRCALAFLEAQTWRESLGPVARSAATGPPVSPPVVKRPVPAPTRRPRPSARPLPIAAAVAGAFALGWLARWKSPPPPEPAAVAVQEVAPRGSFPDELPAPDELPVAPPRPVAAAPTDGGGAGDDSPITDAILDEWQRQGFQVERRRRVVSMGLDDGRSVTVPVNEVRLQYVGDRVY